MKMGRFFRYNRFGDQGETEMDEEDCNINRSNDKSQHYTNSQNKKWNSLRNSQRNKTNTFDNTINTSINSNNTNNKRKAIETYASYAELHSEYGQHKQQQQQQQSSLRVVVVTEALPTKLTTTTTNKSTDYPQATTTAITEMPSLPSRSSSSTASSVSSMTLSTASSSSSSCSSTSTTVKSVELIIKKYQEWSDKLLTNQATKALPSQPTATTKATAPSIKIPNDINVNANNLEFTCESTKDPTNQTSIKSSKSTSRTWLDSTFSAIISSETVPSTQPSSVSSSRASGSSSTSPATSSSGYYSHNQRDSNDTELLVTAMTQRKPNVYDCMRDFLKRKLFNPTASAENPTRAEAKSSGIADGGQRKREGNEDCNVKEEEKEKEKRKLQDGDANEDDDEEEVTSDYDESEVLDSSYNADEEYETDTSSTYTHPNTDEGRLYDLERETLPKSPLASATPPTPSLIQLPLPSLTSLETSVSGRTHNTWSNPTLTSESEDEDGNDNDDSDDAGISDCCQLLSDNKSPKRRVSPKAKAMKGRAQTTIQQSHKEHRTQIKFSTNTSTCHYDDRELLDFPWYQPHLSSKSAASLLLQHESPGAFVIRRTSRHFQLTLRLEPASSKKVKHFKILYCADLGYKFKAGKKQFSSLKALVIHHSVMAEHLPLVLILPRPIYVMQQEQRHHLYNNSQPPWPQQQLHKSSLRRCADDFGTYESLQVLGLLKYLQAEDWEFS